ncbi:MAG: hypothetical protein Q8P41_26760 [Pseudomonadota bacterium]|nr:hypothetical protein [Pseudomonadota bacterium]
MDPRPGPLLIALFKIVAFMLLALNVTIHGTVALFIGGPFGLGVFLLAVVAFWVWASVTLRRWHKAGADERPDAIQAEEHDHDSVGSGVG